MPDTTMNWIDQSWFDQVAEVTEYDNKTLFFTMFTSDKGPEKLGRCSGDDFYKLFGRKLSFAKHGQAILQAKKIIDAGGELLYQRFVAQDATLSNVIVVATVSQVKTQRTDADGNLLYIDATTGEETTVATDNLPLEDSSATIRYDLQSVENAKTFDEVYEAAESLYDADAGTFPIIIAADIGRNADCKRLAIIPDYETSKSLGYMFYTFKEFENTTSEDKASVIMNPDIIYRNKSYALERNLMQQITLDQIKGCFAAFAAKVAEYTGLTAEEVINLDLLFGKNLKGKALDGITIDAEGTDLSYQYGVELKNGSDGTEYGDTPVSSELLADNMVKFLDGDESYTAINDEIYDKDVHKIAAILDANYPRKVKEAIARFVDFREDCFYFRDYGVDISTILEAEKYQEDLFKSRFIGDYITTYQVYDPYTDKRIRVTLTYGLVEGLVLTMQGSPTKPFAGIVNGFTITEAIEGTVNIIPRKTPKANQKDQLKELKVNYGTYYEYNGPLVVDSLFTSQERMSQLSYINNVVGIQEVMRAVRTECPKNRFKFETNEDFAEYQEKVNDVLSNFKSAFKTLKMVYTQDPVRVAQKIFYASILFQFHNWPENEVFDLYALGDEEEV